MRQKVLEWLDSKHPLASDDADLLRLACERREGWTDELSALSKGRPSPPRRQGKEGEQLRERLEQQRRRAREAREELQRARSEAAAALREERKRVRELEKQLAAARREIESFGSAVERQRTESRREDDKTKRELRRALKSIAQLQHDKEISQNELRVAKREARDRARRVRQLVDRLQSPGRTRGQAAPVRTRPSQRKPLAAPIGLTDEAPEALDAWLDAADVRLLVDGYNITKAEGGFGQLPLADQRDRLIEEVARLARRKSLEAIVVFDGSEVAAGHRRRRRRGVDVQYSQPSESADDHLIAVLEALPAEPVVVATNDRELQARAAALGATVAGAQQLLALLQRKVVTPPR